MTFRKLFDNLTGNGFLGNREIYLECKLISLAQTINPNTIMDKIRSVYYF